MLEDIGLMISTTVDILKIEFTLYNFTFSLWQVLLFNLVAGIVIWVIREVLLGD